MRKFLLFLAIFFITQSARADFVPQYFDTIKHWGIGAVSVGQEYLIFDKPEDAAQLVQKVIWDEKGNITCKGDCDDNAFLVLFLPSKNHVILSAVDEDNGWAKVCYGQKSEKFGWIKLVGSNIFIPWSEYLVKYGKQYSYYVFKDISKDEYKLYAQPQDDAQSIDSWEYAKEITPWYVKGNWMMIKVLNFDNTQKTGWFKWRTSDGQLRGFVDLRK